MEVGFPASTEGVLAVGAVDRSGKHAPFSVPGKPVQICAPGEDLESTRLNSSYRPSTGTSPATAVVSGAAALVRAKFPDLSAPEVIHRLTATADDIGKPGRDEECGFGVLNLMAALTADVPPPRPASPTPTTTAEASDDEPASSHTPLIAAAVLLVGGALAMIVIRRRKTTSSEKGEAQEANPSA